MSALRVTHRPASWSHPTWTWAAATPTPSTPIAALLTTVTLVAAALLFGWRTERRPDPTLALLSPTPSAHPITQTR